MIDSRGEIEEGWGLLRDGECRVWDGAQEIPRRVRHVRERGYPVACEHSETRGCEFGRFGYAECDHGVAFALVGNDDFPLSLAENVASEVTPTGENDAVAVVFDELRGESVRRGLGARGYETVPTACVIPIKQAIHVP